MAAPTNNAHPNPFSGSGKDISLLHCLVDSESTTSSDESAPSTTTDSDLSDYIPASPNSTSLRYATPEQEMAPNKNNRREPRLAGYRPGAGKAPRSRATENERNDGGPVNEPTTAAVVDEVAAAARPAASSGGGKDVTLYQRVSSSASTTSVAAGLTDRHEATTVDSADENTVPVTRGRSGAVAAAPAQTSATANPTNAAPGSVIKNPSVGTNAAPGSVIKNPAVGTLASRAPAPKVGGSRRATKKRSAPAERVPAGRTAAGAARNTSSVLRDSTSPERFVRPRPGASSGAHANNETTDEPMTGAAREAAIAQLNDVERQIAEAEARLAASRAREAEFDEKIAGRLEEGSTRWTRRDGARSSRRGPAGEVASYGSKFEGALKKMAGVEEEARRAKKVREEEDKVAALGDRELTSLRQRLEEQERRELEKRLADFTPEELELLRRSYEEEEEE